MKHDHCDQKECEHKKVKYCAKCKMVWCEDCGKEWPEKEDVYQPYRPYRTYWPWGYDPLTNPWQDGTATDSPPTITWGMSSAMETQ